MDRVDENMQHVGICGIYIESFKIIRSCKKLFTQITLSLILPLSIIYLLHMEVSNHIFWRIHYTHFLLHTLTNSTPSSSHAFSRIHSSSEWAIFILFKLAYLTFLLIFSLLSTSAVVYSIANIYTSHPLTFHKVMRVVPNVWKRLLLTFLIIFLAIFVYNILAAFTLTLCLFIAYDHDVIFSPILFILFVSYVVGFVYMTIVWQLASVVTVLEDCYGFKAMIKSKNLIKRKLRVAFVIYFMLDGGVIGTQVLFQMFVVDDFDINMWRKIGYGVLCVLLLVTVILVGLVVVTIIYFVCKSVHEERIDKVQLCEHLDGYLYERLNKEKEVELEHQQG